MGVVVELFIVPAAEATLTHDRFAAFVLDLSTKHIARPPYTVMHGGLPDYPSRLWRYARLGVGHHQAAPPRQPYDITVTAQGEDLHVLEQAISELPYQELDCAVWFHGFDLSCDQTIPGFAPYDPTYTGNLVACSFREARQIGMFDAYDGAPDQDVPLNQFLYFHGKTAVADLALAPFDRLPLHPLVVKHFGAEPVIYSCTS